MPCHQQLGCTEAGDAAAEIICREHGGAKKLLVDTLPHKAFAFQTLFRQFVFVNFREVLKSLPGKLSAQALTFERERFGVAVEFVPDLFLTLCPMRHAANSTRSLLWIKAGEISKFVRNRTNAAAQKFGELDYLRIIDVNGPERDFAIQVERENVFLACPVSVASVKRTSNYTGESEFMVGPQYLEPVTQENLKKGETRQFWITFHVADDVASGVYRAELELASNGHIEKIPVEFQVYPFKLRAIENLDIGFWLDMQSYNNPNGKDGIDRDIKDMAEHGINSVVVQSSLIINGKTLDALKIDFEKSLLTAVAESFKKYKMNGYLHLMTQQIWEYVMTFPEGERRQAYTKLITLLEDYAKKNNWPKRAYQSYDEVLSSPGNLPEFIREVKLQRELGLTTSDDHIWYKTCRPFQKEVDEIASSIDIFINRYNNRRLFYVNSWEEMLAQAVKRGTKLYTYNTTNCMTFAQLAAMRCLGGWFFRTVGKGCSGQLFWTYKLIQGNPYNDLDGEIGDFLCQYPPYGKRKGGPAIDWEAHREGIDDLRYVITLEHLISQARKENRISEADAAQKVLDSIAGSFDWNKFREKSIYWDSKWTEAWEHNGKRYAAGQYNIPNGWTLEDYDLARHRIADEIIKLQSKK